MSSKHHRNVDIQVVRRRFHINSYHIWEPSSVSSPVPGQFLIFFLSHTFLINSLLICEHSFFTFHHICVIFNQHLPLPPHPLPHASHKFYRSYIRHLLANCKSSLWVLFQTPENVSTRRTQKCNSGTSVKSAQVWNGNKWNLIAAENFLAFGCETSHFYRYTQRKNSCSNIGVQTAAICLSFCFTHLIPSLNFSGMVNISLIKAMVWRDQGHPQQTGHYVCKAQKRPKQKQSLWLRSKLKKMT